MHRLIGDWKKIMHVVVALLVLNVGLPVVADVVKEQARPHSVMAGIAEHVGTPVVHAQTACWVVYEFMANNGGQILWMEPGDVGFSVHYGAIVQGHYFEDYCWFP